MLNIVLFGPPGSGKGTQSATLIEKYSLVHLSTGDILRGEIAAKTPLGIEAAKKMDKGELVPDEVVIGMIGNKLEANAGARGFIFDGFPRTTAQAEALDKLLKEKGTSISLMLSLEVEKEELIKRLLNRGKDSGRADDQNINVIENRIAVYNKETAVVADYYKKQNKFQAIQGMGAVSEIFDRLCKAIDQAKG
ncbi:MAG TPA: adenylate kinase [Bacteroidales bacterium]|nr:adenylate kinase [Bacteroidales bacterium]